jgi:hypothetical protein
MGKPPARSRITRERDAKTVAFAEAKDGKKPKKGAPAADADAPTDKATTVDAATTTSTSETATTDTTAVVAEPATPTPTPAPAPTPAPTPAQDATTMPMAIIASEPPAMPGAVEDPTHMPHPRDVPSGGADAPAPPPGRVPPGDSRSLRNATQFALIYRIGTFVITRAGSVGTRGQWRVVEYPTSAAASHAYAKESSRFVSEGFSDYRD